MYFFLAAFQGMLDMHDMRLITLILLLSGQLLAQTTVSNPSGYNNVQCLASSDTIVGVPMRVQGSRTTTLTAAPSIAGGSATLTLATGSLAAGALTNNYLKFKTGYRNGRFYNITGNTTNTVTINLNGDTLSDTGGSVAIGDYVLIAQYWTLNTLLPAANATTAWTQIPSGSKNYVQNGTAVVASTSSTTNTQVLLPNLAGTGINIAPAGTYFVLNGVWNSTTTGTTDEGNTVLYPDTYIIVRHPTTVSYNTVFSNLGEVEKGYLTIPLTTQATAQQDSSVAIPRPVGVTLSGLNLIQSGDFMASTGTASSLTSTTLRDVLFVFGNTTKALNKAASSSSTIAYYNYQGSWLKVGGGTTNYNSTVIPAGTGMIVRKYKVTGAPTTLWNDPPTY